MRKNYYYRNSRLIWGAITELLLEKAYQVFGTKRRALSYNIHRINHYLYQGAHYFRPTEVYLLIGDVTKAREKLGWIPEFDLRDLIKDMMQNDVSLMKKELYLKKVDTIF